MPRSFLVKTKQQQLQQRCVDTERMSNDVRDDGDDVRASRRLSQPSTLCDTQPQLHTGQYRNECLYFTREIVRNENET